MFPPIGIGCRYWGAYHNNVQKQTKNNIKLRVYGLGIEPRDEAQGLGLGVSVDKIIIICDTKVRQGHVRCGSRNVSLVELQT